MDISAARIPRSTDQSTDDRAAGIRFGIVDRPELVRAKAGNSAIRRHEQTIAAGGEVTEEIKKAYEATAARELSYKEPDEVSTAFMHALFGDNPLRRYVVVPNVDEQDFTVRTKLTELVQLGEWGPYSYSRDQLVERLDDVLSGEAPSE